MHHNSKTARIHGRLFPQPDDMCSCNCTGHSFFSSDSSYSSSSSSSSSPDSHPKEALMISISSTAPPRKKESYCQLFKHLPFSNEKTTTTTTTTTNKQPTRNQLSFLPSFRNTSTKLHSNKAITGSIKQAPKLSCKKSVSEQTTAARARNHHQNKTKQKNTVAGKQHSFLWCLV
jgi:hypothetical protein